MRWLSTTVGIAASLFGLGLAFLGSSVAPFTLDSGMTLVVGGLALFGVGLFISKRVEPWPESHVTTPDVEHGTRVPTPGTGFDRVLSDPDSEYARSAGETNRGYVHSVARRLVRTTLEVELDYSPEEAERRIERGTWTDDPVAAWFLGDEDAKLPARLRLRARLDPEAMDEHAIRRTIDAIERVRDGAS